MCPEIVGRAGQEYLLNKISKTVFPVFKEKFCCQQKDPFSFLTDFSFSHTCLYPAPLEVNEIVQMKIKKSKIYFTLMSPCSQHPEEVCFMTLFQMKSDEKHFEICLLNLIHARIQQMVLLQNIILIYSFMKF